MFLYGFQKLVPEADAKITGNRYPPSHSDQFNPRFIWCPLREMVIMCLNTHSYTAECVDNRNPSKVSIYKKRYPITRQVPSGGLLRCLHL